MHLGPFSGQSRERPTPRGRLGGRMGTCSKRRQTQGSGPGPSLSSLSPLASGAPSLHGSLSCSALLTPPTGLLAPGPGSRTLGLEVGGSRKAPWARRCTPGEAWPPPCSLGPLTTATRAPGFPPGHGAGAPRLGTPTAGPPGLVTAALPLSSCSTLNVIETLGWAEFQGDPVTPSPPCVGGTMNMRHVAPLTIT